MLLYNTIATQQAGNLQLITSGAWGVRRLELFKYQTYSTAISATISLYIKGFTHQFAV